MICDMAKRQAPSSGRPSKGERDLMVTRLPVADGKTIRQLAEDYDWSYSETVAELVRIALLHQDELPPRPETSPSTQQELPLTRAS